MSNAAATENMSEAPRPMFMAAYDETILEPAARLAYSASLGDRDKARPLVRRCPAGGDVVQRGQRAPLAHAEEDAAGDEGW